jgi:hypothetical protein
MLLPSQAANADAWMLCVAEAQPMAYQALLPAGIVNWQPFR